MFIWHLLLAALLGILLTSIFAVGFRRRGPWASLIVFFLVVFLITWAGGIWISPIGPVFYGVYWLPFLIVGLIIALLLAAIVPGSMAKEMEEDEVLEPRAREKALEQKRQEVRESTFDLFFWLLLVVVLAAILAGYFAPRV